MGSVVQGDRFRGLDIVWLQSPPWHGVWTRQNHFSRRLAKEGARILYVENPEAIAVRLKSGRSSRSSVEVEPGISVMDLPLQVPGARASALIGNINGRRFASAIRAEMTRLEFGRPIVWCRQPMSVHALRNLDALAVVYDVTDDYDYYAKSLRERALTQRRERELASLANQIFTTTEQLRQKLSSMTETPVTQVRNGVDSVFFQIPSGDDPLAKVARPRIGFVGVVAAWMDFELLERLGARWPGQVVVVGPVKPEVEDRFRTISGLVRIGPVPHLEVPRYLYSFDVCVLPHEVSELRHRSDPLKILEYLATGKPVVSVALRALQGMGPMVDLARSPDEFIDLVARRLEDPMLYLGDARRDLAASRNWDNLYKVVSSHLLGIWRDGAAK